MNLRVILTGATGMVGEGVLLECLQSPAVAHVLALTRKPIGRTHPKMSELLVPDLADLSAVKGKLYSTRSELRISCRQSYRLV